MQTLINIRTCQFIHKRNIIHVSRVINYSTFYQGIDNGIVFQVLNIKF